jgi:predicted amidohydrolase
VNEPSNTTSSRRIGLVQQALYWQDPKANCAALDAVLAECAPGHQLLVLPETFSTGFTMDANQVAEDMSGTTVGWLKQRSEQWQTALVASLPIRHNGGISNRMLWVEQGEVRAIYDKKHLFRMAGEDRKYVPGSQQITLDWRGFQVRLLVCYDLRFPAWCRSNGKDDLQIYIANWPAPRHKAWQRLLAARAVENQCFVVGVNRCGEDPNGHHYLGGSVLHDPLGDALLQAGASAGVFSLDIDLGQAADSRQRLPFFTDADHFRLSP